MKINVKQRGNTTITLARDTRDELIYLKIKTQAKNLDEVIKDLLKK